MFCIAQVGMSALNGLVANPQTQDLPKPSNNTLTSGPSDTPLRSSSCSELLRAAARMRASAAAFVPRTPATATSFNVPVNHSGRNTEGE